MPLQSGKPNAEAPCMYECNIQVGIQGDAYRGRATFMYLYLISPFFERLKSDIGIEVLVKVVGCMRLDRLCYMCSQGEQRDYGILLRGSELGLHLVRPL